MTDYNLDLIREELTEQVGEKVLYLWEIRKIVNNLGADYLEGTIRNHLKNCKTNNIDYIKCHLRNINLDALKIFADKVDNVKRI